MSDKLDSLIRFLDHLECRASMKELTAQLRRLEIDDRDVAEFIRFADPSYQRVLVRARRWYHLWILCWKNGQRSPIHDHLGSSCGVRVLRGTATVTDCVFAANGCVKAVGSRDYPAGSVLTSEDDDLHQFSNLQDGGADLVTLHVYSPPLRRMGVYSLTDRERGEEAWQESRKMVTASPENSETPLDSIQGWVTPNRLFFVRNHFEMPALEPSSWRLRVEGCVERPVEWTWEQLLALPHRSVFATVECAGNGRSFLQQKAAGVQWGAGAVGHAEWTGVPLARVLEESGVRADAVEVLFEGSDRLERKFRYLFGAIIVLLLTGSFRLYSWQTESLAYDQIKTACRLLVNEIVDQQLALGCRPGQPREKDRPAATEALDEAMKEFRAQWENEWPLPFKFRADIIKPNATRSPDIPDTTTLERVKSFQNDPNKYEDNYLDLSRKHNYYYGAVRATESCLLCHRQRNADLQEGDLLAVVKLDVDTQPIENGFHTNRAILISIAFATTFLIMLGSYLIVRYVIVKPVKHLKEVSDAISAGELNVRSEIQTGDEFEDLSHAFNRMLRNLVSMQDRLRRVNADLDRKVDELAQANMALYESNRLKSDFLATMSHELRTPLNSILGFSEVLLSNDGLNDKQTRWVTNIQSSGQQLLNLINDILDLAKIEAGKMQVRLV